MNRLARPVAMLARWYATATGTIYLVLVSASVVATIFSPRVGILIGLVVVAVAVPYKLARLDGQRRASEWELSSLRSQVTGLGAQVKELRTSVSGFGDRSQQVRRDALSAVDTARHEWAEILRAERRLTEAHVRTVVEREMVAKLVATDDHDDADPSSSSSRSSTS